jgi:hypothetical protein
MISKDPATVVSGSSGGVYYLTAKNGDLFCLGNEAQVLANNDAGRSLPAGNIKILAKTQQVATYAFQNTKLPAGSSPGTVQTIDFSEASSIKALPDFAC